MLAARCAAGGETLGRNGEPTALPSGAVDPPPRSECRSRSAAEPVDEPVRWKPGGEPFSATVTPTVQWNSELTDSPLWMRRMASAIAGAIDSTLSLGTHLSFGSGTLFVHTISRTSSCSW